MCIRDRIDRSGAQFFIHEERSADRETSHAAEEVGFIAIQNGLIYEDPLLA